MDDHVYEYLVGYHEDEIVEFLAEYKEHRKMQDCPIYDKIKDICTCLSLVLKWAHQYPVGAKVTPTQLLRGDYFDMESIDGTKTFFEKTGTKDYAEYCEKILGRDF